MRRGGAILVLQLAAAGGCTGDDGSTSVDPTQVIRACTILHACGGEPDLHNCVYNLDVSGAATRISCVLAATAADSSATPDLLRILGREDDENSHSDLIAWLLSPKRAPNVAPHALLHLVAGLENADQWRRCINKAVASELVSIRHENACRSRAR